MTRLMYRPLRRRLAMVFPVVFPARANAIVASVLALAFLCVHAAQAEPRPSIAMYGAPTYAAGFASMRSVNPMAPKGGRVTIGVQGTFNSLNPLTYKGESASGVREYVYESLMARGSEEPFSLYGLIAESIDVPDDRRDATFVIRPEARFSDGSPITADDVVFSYELLRARGWPFMRASYGKVARAIKLGDRSVRFEFAADGDRELPLLMGLMPILPKATTDAESFEQTTLTPPIASGPYTVARIDPGRTIVYRRNPKWWARDLPIMRGRFNFDEVRVEYFRDGGSLFEAFKAGTLDVFTEDDPNRWATGYTFPAMSDGRILKKDLPTALPAGMSGFVFNTRRAVFQDRRVREALLTLFDAEWINRSLYGGLYRRTQSWFDRSALSSAGVPVDAEEQRLLTPFPDAVKPAIADGSYVLPRTAGTGVNRDNQTAALKLLRDAGYELRGQRLVQVATGLPLTFEALITSPRQARLLLAYGRSLEAVGIKLAIREVDSAQYEARLKSNDFDMVQAFWASSLSPGNEQWNRWGSRSADLQGTRNYAGVKSAAVDAMITAMVSAREPATFTSAVRAFDRVLRSGDYVIPLFHPPTIWVAHWARIQGPAVPPNSGFDLDTWWSANASEAVQ